MSINRTASSVVPFFATRALRASRPIPLSKRHPGYPPFPFAIFVQRALSTDTSSSPGGAGNFPPPGFNTEDAKKPLRQEERQTRQSNDANSTRADPLEQHLPLSERPTNISKDEPTAHPKTQATESHVVKELALEQAASEQHSDKKIEERKKEDKKLTLWQKVKREAHHYWDGTKLLGTEIKISSRLALKMAAGYELTRRETRQLYRTVQDLGRLVPFSAFVIVPFAELLLPVALKLFPNLLPSTYEGQKSKDEKAQKLRGTRKEVSNFLRQTLKESGLPITAANAQKEEFMDFFRKVRTTGESPSADEVIKVCKIFKDDLTLDNLSRPQLVGMARYMNLSTFGTDAILRYNIRHRMRQLKRDDKAIAYEGVDTLSVPELQMACASRGLRTHGMSPARLREDLQMWLDLRLKYGVPSTLLVLSNAFNYAQGKDVELNSQIDALKAVLASVPEELFHEIELEVHTAEGAATNKQRLEVLKEQQELIEEENEDREESGKSGPKDDENIDDKEEATVSADSTEKSQVDEKKA